MLTVNWDQLAQPLSANLRQFSHVFQATVRLSCEIKNVLNTERKTISLPSGSRQCRTPYCEENLTAGELI